MTNKKPEKTAVAKLREIYFEMRKNRKPSRTLLDILEEKKPETSKNNSETTPKSNKKVASPRTTESEL